MKKLLLMLVSVGLLAANDDIGANKPKPRFPLSKETTYVTEPLDADGYIDYVAALNERLRKGVTPANNANVLLWKAFGPHPERATMPEVFFPWLGIKPPPEKGDYFIRLSIQDDRTFDELERCWKRPWTAKDHPKIAEWLKANEKPLDWVRQATRRTQYYSPLTPRKTSKNASRLTDAPLHGVQTCRSLASALAAHAMLRAGERRFDDAWQDLLTCHRLGRLVSRGATPIELLVGIAVDSFASNTDLALLECADWSAERIKKCLRDLRELPPMSPVADKVDLGERFMFLDFIVMVDRFGIDALEEKESNPLAKFFHRGIKWERALRNGNHWFDRMSKALREKDCQKREKALEGIRKELDTLVTKSAASRPGILQLLFVKDADKQMGEQIGNLFLGLLVPAIQKVQNAADRSEQQQNNLYLAFALAAYRRDRGHYPKDLAALTPKYLDKIPMDIFSGQPLVYRPSENGYLLYSVGVNGRDENGRGYSDTPQGDDLSVRMPQPK